MFPVSRSVCDSQASVLDDISTSGDVMIFFARCTALWREEIQCKMTICEAPVYSLSTSKGLSLFNHVETLHSLAVMCQRRASIHRSMNRAWWWLMYVARGVEMHRYNTDSFIHSLIRSSIHSDADGTKKTQNWSWNQQYWSIDGIILMELVMERWKGMSVTGSQFDYKQICFAAYSLLVGLFFIIVASVLCLNYNIVDYIWTDIPGIDIGLVHHCHFCFLTLYSVWE